MRQVLSAANAVAQRDSTGPGQDPQHGVYVIAAVVTAAPMFTCRLESSGQIHLSPTDHAAVYAHHNGPLKRVHVLHEYLLPSFIEQMRDLARRAHRT